MPRSAPPDACDRCGVRTCDLYSSYDLGWICERCAFCLDPEALRDLPWDWTDDLTYSEEA